MTLLSNKTNSVVKPFQRSAIRNLLQTSAHCETLLIHQNVPNCRIPDFKGRRGGGEYVVTQDLTNNRPPRLMEHRVQCFVSYGRRINSTLIVGYDVLRGRLIPIAHATEVLRYTELITWAQFRDVLRGEQSYLGEKFMAVCVRLN